MDYDRIYREFIADRKAKPKPEGYTERHHIVPRSLGGHDGAENLIDLTARDHYFAHCCLAKMHGGKMWSALFAVAAMAKHEESWAYFCRRRMVEASREKAAHRRSEHMTALWGSNQFKRNRTYRSWTPEERAQRSAAIRGRKMRPEVLERMREARLSQGPVIEFVHLDGRTFTGTPAQFRQASGLSQSLVSYLKCGKIRAARGWVINGTDPRSVYGRDPQVREWRHKDGITFLGTVHEFRQANPALDCGSVSKQISGKLKVVGGWRLILTTEPSE